MDMATELSIFSGVTALIVGCFAAYYFIKLSIEGERGVHYWLTLGIALSFGCGGLSRSMLTAYDVLLYFEHSPSMWLKYEPLHLLLRFGALSGLILHLRTFTYAWAGMWVAAAWALCLFSMFLILEAM